MIRYPSTLVIAISLSLLLDAAAAPPDPKPEPTTPALCGAGASTTAALPQSLADWAKGAQIFPGLGSFHRPADTTNPSAQAYFDQGMRLTWAFNHDEATRSFAKAAEIDPGCAMCFWGVALTLGPNYNMPMMLAPRARVGWEALTQAVKRAPHVAPVDRAMIAALAHRYTGAQPIDPTNIDPVNVAYSEAMTKAADAFPNDLDLQTLAAEAQMNVLPWKLWTDTGEPAPGTAAIVARLESVLGRDPAHPGANHYYIHAVEASKHPERALASAERLKAMMPAAGHLVHMPSHILQLVGRYEASAEANRKGAAADLAYFAQTKAPDYYPMYTAHNYQFLAFATAMEGRRAETLAAVRHARAALSDDLLLTMPGVDWQVGYLYDVMTRFGLWRDLLAEPAPNPKLTALTASWLANRAVALAATGKTAEARATLAKLDTLIAATPADAQAGLNLARDVFAVIRLRAEARIAEAEHGAKAAVPGLTRAVALESKLAYNEPADIFFPTRELLGAALLRAGDPRTAEAVFREDLRRNPDNGWSLIGLSQALAAQGKPAAPTQQRFEVAWARADTKLAAAAF